MGEAKIFIFPLTYFKIKIIKIIELLLHKYINYDMVNIYQYIKLNTFAKEGAMHTEVHNAVTAADQGTQYALPPPLQIHSQKYCFLHRPLPKH